MNIFGFYGGFMVVAVLSLLLLCSSFRGIKIILLAPRVSLSLSSGGVFLVGSLTSNY